MTVPKTYALIWLFVLAVAGVVYLTGSFNSIALTIFGLFISTLTFMGVVAVLPILLDSHYAPKTHPAYQASTRRRFANIRK